MTRYVQAVNATIKGKKHLIQLEIGSLSDAIHSKENFIILVKNDDSSLSPMKPDVECGHHHLKRNWINEISQISDLSSSTRKRCCFHVRDNLQRLLNHGKNVTTRICSLLWLRPTIQFLAFSQRNATYHRNKQQTVTFYIVL